MVKNLRGIVNRKIAPEERQEEKPKDEMGEDTKTINNPVILPYNGSFK